MGLFMGMGKHGEHGNMSDMAAMGLPNMRTAGQLDGAHVYPRGCNKGRMCGCNFKARLLYWESDDEGVIPPISVVTLHGPAPLLHFPLHHLHPSFRVLPHSNAGCS